MRLTALHKRAASEGVDADAVDDAMDGDDPKASLVAAIVAVAAQRGPTDRLLSALTEGGEMAVDAVCSVLDHAMDVLEALSLSSRLMMLWTKLITNPLSLLAVFSNLFCA